MYKFHKQNEMPATYGNLDCDASQDTWPVMGGNVVYINNGATTPNTVTGLCGTDEKSFQQTYGRDLGTVILNSPNDKEILKQAKAMLWA